MGKILFLLCLAMFACDLMAANINIGPNGCSLADAIRSANTNSSHGNCAAGSSSDFIIAPDDWEVTLSADLPAITSDLTIQSASPAGLFYISGGNNRRVLAIIGNNIHVTLNRVQIFNGRLDQNAFDPLSFLAGRGAGIRIDGATVYLKNSILRDNTAADFHNAGSGIYVVNGDLTIENSLVQGNRQGSQFGDSYAVYAKNSYTHIIDTTFGSNNGRGFKLDGGDLLVENTRFNESEYAISGEAGTAIINNSTFDPVLMALDFSNSQVILNHSTIWSPSSFIGGTLTVTNSLIGECHRNNALIVLVNSHNLNPGSSPPRNCLGLTERYLYLAPLADNGGPTMTRAFLGTESAAINAGDPAYCLEFDQRGERRDAQCDVGAYEAVANADIEVNSSIEESPPYASEQQITYYAEITNNGPDVADSIAIDIHSNFANIDNFDSPFCNAVDCVIESIQPGQTLVIPIRMTLAGYVKGAFQVELSAHSSAGSVYTDFDEDDVGGNNRNIISYDINAAADMAVEMELNTGPPYVVGQTITYTATINNQGQQTANSATLLFLPSGLANIVFSGCTSASGGICALGHMANGASKTITIRAEIDADQFNATATVGSALFDPDNSNNTDNKNNGGGVFESDIHVTMSVLDPAPFTSLQYIRFRILVSARENAASNLRVYYDFPGSEFITIDGCAGYPCEIPLLAANEEIELTAQFFAPLARPDAIEKWSMQVLVLPGQVDPNLDDNEVTIEMPLAPVADVASQLKLLSQPPFYAGQEIQYSLRVVNGGPNAVTKVDVSLQSQNLSLVYANGDLCPTVNCDINKLNAFDEENITLVYSIDDVGEFDLISNAIASELDSVPANNLDNKDNGGIALSPPEPPAPVVEVIFSDSFEDLN